jgi:hypothetical protein
MATKNDPYAKFRKLKKHPDPDKMTPAERKLYGEYLESEEQKFRPLDTPSSPYLFPNLHMEKPTAKKKTAKAKPKKK